MRTAICKNLRLQPDHFSFDREAALQLLQSQEGDSTFKSTYSAFIDIFEVIRSQLSIFNLSSTDCLDLAKAAIVSCLAEGHSIFSRQQPAYLSKLERPTTSMDVENVRDIQREDGNFYTGDEILEATFETLKSILDYCEYLKTVHPSPKCEPSTYDVGSLIRIFNFYVIYKADWEECLWLGNDINVEEERMWRNPALLSRAIGLSRDFSLEFQHILAGNIVSSKVARHRFVSGRLAPNRKISRDFGKFRRSMLEHIHYPFLSWVVKQEMERKSIISRVIDLYLFIVFISIGNIKRSTGSHSVEAFVFADTELENYLCAQLSLSGSDLSAALVWLKFRPRQRTDIWFTPLYWIEGHYVLFSPMCAYANFVRFVESIFERAEGWNSGQAFERYVTGRLQAAVRNPSLPKLSVIGPAKYKGQNGREEIDLLIVSSSTVFIGEVKYDCFTSDEINIFQHIEKMRQACSQAARKADFLRTNWAALAAGLGLSPTATVFAPFALTEKPFVSGFSFGGVPILALRDFEDFFEGEMRFNVVVGHDGSASGGEVVATFRNAQTMADDLRAYMIASPRTERFSERLRILKRDRPPNDFVLQKYIRFQFEVS